jgi:site-specific DNA-methyltransferase (cytosine-N4-specific)
MSHYNYTHNLFPYPAKFPPEPIRKHILHYSKPGEKVLDPFCGSGTVLIESILHNRNAVGIDLNPVSCLISKVKSTIYTKEQIGELKLVIKQVEEAINDYAHWKSSSLSVAPTPNYKNIEHWFKPEMIEELSAIKYCFLSNVESSIHDLLWMGFLSIIVTVSRQDNDTRYAAIEKPEVQPRYALLRLKAALENYYKTLGNSFEKLDNSSSSTKVHEGDSTKVLDSLDAGQFSLAITSPPYINTFDYYLYHKHRIFWMGKNPQEVRRREIGCHHRIDTKSFEDAFREYYDDLLKIMVKVNRCLVNEGRFIWLIGDGIVKSQVIKANDLLVELSAKSGYAVEDIQTIGLRDVSKGFIKGKTLDLKQHHTVILKKTHNATT